MDIIAIKVATLKAVLKCQPLEIPKWPVGCTPELLLELRADGYLEWKDDNRAYSGGWASLPVEMTSYREYHVTPAGKEFIKDNS